MMSRFRMSQTDTLSLRDRIDSSREVAPLRAADDAVIIDTTDLPVEQVLQRVLALCDPGDGADR